MSQTARSALPQGGRPARLQRQAAGIPHRRLPAAAAAGAGHAVLSECDGTHGCTVKPAERVGVRPDDAPKVPSELPDRPARAQDRDARPTGQLRLAVSSIAERFISGPLLASFTHAHPAVQIDVTVTDEEFDIVAEGYDAGVRLGEVIEQDMIAVPVSGDQRQLVVAAPSYLKRFGAPSHPAELSQHCCIGWRPAPDVAPYRWEFEQDGREFDVAVNPRITTNDMGVMVRTACAGGGLTFGMEETFRPYIDRGELVPLLEQYCPPFQGFYLYFPDRRHLAPKLRVLIDHVRYRATSVRRRGRSRL